MVLIIPCIREFLLGIKLINVNGLLFKDSRQVDMNKCSPIPVSPLPSFTIIILTLIPEFVLRFLVPVMDMKGKYTICMRHAHLQSLV